MGITRKLGNICQSLTLPAEKGMVVEYLTNAENAQRINSLVEDMCEALMVYQVCMSNYSFLLCLTFMLDFIPTRYP